MVTEFVELEFNPDSEAKKHSKYKLVYSQILDECTLERKKTAYKRRQDKAG